MRYNIGRHLFKPSIDTFVLLTLGNKWVVRPETYTRFYEVRGWKLEAIGSKKLMEDIIHENS